MHPSEHDSSRAALIMGDSGHVTTFGELTAAANRISHLFRGHGLDVGDHVAMAIENPGRDRAVYFADGPPFRYHKDDEKTASVHNDAGWAQFGDIGHLDEDGFLHLQRGGRDDTGKLLKRLLKDEYAKTPTPAG